jgi:RNA polymerase sigma factor (sigma-70 family)
MPPSEQARWFSDEVKPYEPALRAYLLKRFPSLPDHDDLVQETYTRLLRAKENGRLTYAKAFLFTVARNLAVDVFRRRRSVTHEQISEQEVMPALEESPDVVSTLDQRQRLEILVQAVQALPERCRQVMMLRHLDGLAYKEIAVRMGISPETVKVHMLKGVRHCTAYFREKGLIGPPPPSETCPPHEGS